MALSLVWLRLPAAHPPGVSAPPWTAPRHRAASSGVIMVILREREAEILRYYHVEKWRVGTIARQIGVHHNVVKRVLAQAGLPRLGTPRPSQLDPFLPFIHQTLEKFPALTASRLYGMVRERGYRGGPDHFRHLVACYRPRPAAEAYLRLGSLPAEQAQVDWGHFGHLLIGRARRPLMAFVMVLSYSRQIFLRFYRCSHGELPARPRRGFHCLGRCRQGPAVR